MKTKVTYYAEKLAKGQLSAYSVSKHFFSMEQLKKTLKLAEILKEHYLKRDEIYEAWDEYENELILGDYYDPDYNNDYYEYDSFEDGETKIEWPDETNVIDLPSDREIWILRQARNAAYVFPVIRPYVCLNIPEEAWKKFFKTYKLSQSERDMFWMEYHLHACEGV